MVLRGCMTLRSKEFFPVFDNLKSTTRPRRDPQRQPPAITSAAIRRSAGPLWVKNFLYPAQR